MSDEQLPPPLRLRPRNRDADIAPAKSGTPVIVPVDQSIGIPAAPEVASVTDTTSGRFRLKPKMAPGADEPTMSSELPAITPLQSADTDTVNVPRLKLKVATSVASDPTVEYMPDAEVVPVIFVSPTAAAGLTDAAATEIEAIPGPEDPAALLIIPGATPTVDFAVEPQVAAVVVASPIAPVAPTAAGVKPLKPKAAPSAPRRLLLGLLALVLLGGGAGTYFFLMQEDPPAPPPVIHRPVAPLVPKVAPTAPVVAPPAPPSVPTPESLGLDPLPATLETQPAEAVVVVKPKPTKAPVAPVMTAAFRLWIEGVRINGVTTSAGAAPRVIINGRLVRPGDTLESTEGIVFESLDTERKCVLFRNRAGVVATKQY